MDVKCYILYNPFAGNGGSEATARKLADCAEYEGAEIVAMTQIRSYAEFLADKQDASLIICGGDGTLNRFVNDIGDTPHGDVYYMASGSGNDFLRDIGTTVQTEPILINKYIEKLPVCEVNGKKYKVLNGVGYGIDGYCCMLGDAMKAQKEEKIDYTAIAIGGLLGKYKPCGGTITVDGESRTYKKIWIAPAMNGRFYGGGIMPCPEQDRIAGDGNISSCVVYGTGRLQTLLIFPSLFKGEHTKHVKNVDLRTGKHITVEFDSPRPLQMDGETIKGVTKFSMYYEN